MKILIIIPTYNEVENLESLVDQIFQHDLQFQILVVDDGSPDGTGHLAERLAQKHPHFHVLHRPAKQGLGPAYIAGFSWGLSRDFDALVEMDADFSHHPSFLVQMRQSLTQADVAIGSRNVAGGGTLHWGWVRKFLSWGGSLYARLILGTSIQDFTGGFNGWRRRVLEQIELSSVVSDGYSFQIELKYRASLLGFRIVEFPIVFADRKVGQSKMSGHIVLEALHRVWLFRWRARGWRRRMRERRSPLN